MIFFYKTFISRFLQTPSRRALRFLEINNTIEIKKQCVCFRSFAFFYLFYIFDDVRVPLAPPLGQIGPMFGRMWWHCWSMLVEVVEGRLIDEAA